MPKLGEVRRASEIGKDIGAQYRGRKFIWAACADCKAERWVRMRNKKPERLHCSSCANRNTLKTADANHFWKGGRVKHNGYIGIYVVPDDFFYPMANRCYILEHRLVMAKSLSRCLLSWEIVHHKNGIKDDNRIENLQLLPNRAYHIGDSLLKQRLKQLEIKVEKQANLIKLLQWQIKESGLLAYALEQKD